MNKYLNPHSYINKFRKILYLNLLLDWEKINKEEDLKLKSLGFLIDEALSKLNPIFKNKVGRKFDFQKDSIHLLIWSLIASGAPIKRILEIGTSKGEGTKILAELFPKAEIITIDLPENDPILRSTYGREAEIEYLDYLTLQKKNLAYPNIKSIKKNSFFILSEVQGKFDLIWIDGGHRYPDVAWDFSNAWFLCSEGGIILCDDVLTTEKKVNTNYTSSESFEIIKYLEERLEIEPIHFLKRRNPNFYPFLIQRKYVTYIRKSNKMRP